MSQKKVHLYNEAYNDCLTILNKKCCILSFSLFLNHTCLSGPLIFCLFCAIIQPSPLVAYCMVLVTFIYSPPPPSPFIPLTLFFEELWKVSITL